MRCSKRQIKNYKGDDSGDDSAVILPGPVLLRTVVVWLEGFVVVIEVVVEVEFSVIFTVFIWTPLSIGIGCWLSIEVDFFRWNLGDPRNVIFKLFSLALQGCGDAGVDACVVVVVVATAALALDKTGLAAEILEGEAFVVTVPGTVEKKVFDNSLWVDAD